jgi:SWI/SNF-related matrix-associated actin-dependent regulator of chromatin subfamily A3
VLKRFQDDLDNLVSNQSKTKKYAILFAMVMKLRRLCNHGTMNITEQLSLGSALEQDSDAFCDYCQGSQQDNLAILNKDQICPECSKIISASSPLAMPSTSPTNSPTFGHLMVDQTSPNFPLRPGLNPSTKLSAVVENLKAEVQGSKR